MGMQSICSAPRAGNSAPNCRATHLRVPSWAPRLLRLPLPLELLPLPLELLPLPHEQRLQRDLQGYLRARPRLLQQLLLLRPRGLGGGPLHHQGPVSACCWDALVHLATLSAMPSITGEGASVGVLQ